MKYFFILGNNRTLSIAELSAIFCLNKNNEYPKTYLIPENIFILETKNELNTFKLIKKLGGTIKIGIINNEVSTTDYEKIKEKIIKILNINNIKNKFKFGISYYGKNKLKIKPIAMGIKKKLHEKKISSQWVTSKKTTLSSVIVDQNKLTTNGAEFILIKNKNNLFICRTLSVQPFKELSFRDYGRPARDDRSGMLPPKLAQIMLRLSKVKYNEKILDPFCGSGTILTEAMLMGYKNLTGTDISKKAIQNTKQNIKWVKNNCKIKNLKIINYELFNIDAKKLSKTIKLNSMDAIITEPYLGPQTGKIDIKKTKEELEQLYSESLFEFKKILKLNGKIVIIFPIFKKEKRNKDIYITPNLNGFKIINPISKNLQNNKIIKLTDRNTIVYGREKQKIWREIVVLKKQ